MTTLRLSLRRNDPLNTTLLTGDGAPLYTVETTSLGQQKGKKLTTVITRRNGPGDHMQVGVIDWPRSDSVDQPIVVIGTKPIELSKTGIVTASEFFQVKDSYFEWQIRNCSPQLVRYQHPPTSGAVAQTPIASFVNSTSRPSLFCAKKVHSASLFVSPEGSSLLDEIVVTFVYFESKWREKERGKAKGSPVEVAGVVW